MKRQYILFIYLFIAMTACKAQDDIQLKLDSLLLNNQFIELQNTLSQLPHPSTNNKYAFYRAFCLNALGQFSQSADIIQHLMSNKSGIIGQERTIHLIELQARNYFNLFQYEEAATLYSTLLSKFSDQLPPQKTDLFHDLYNITHTLAKAEIAPQKAHIKKDSSIPIYHNVLNQLMIPIASEGKHEDFVFDTGAMLSIVSESTAQKLNMKVFDTTVHIKTATQVKIESRIAVAKQIQIGSVFFDNAVFLVTDDSNLHFNEIEYDIPGIIGLPLIMQLKEVQIDLSHNRLTIPLIPTQKSFSNLFLVGQTPVVEVQTPNELLHLSLDSGASQSELSNKYFNKHQTEILALGTKETIGRGGAGGTIQEEVILYPEFNYKIGSKKGSLPYITINLNNYDYIKDLDGIMGQDILLQHDITILNFQSMFIDFK